MGLLSQEHCRRSADHALSMIAACCGQGTNRQVQSHQAKGGAVATQCTERYDGAATRQIAVGPGDRPRPAIDRATVDDVMALASGDVIAARLLVVVLRYVGIALFLAWIALSGFVVFSVRWWAGGTGPAIGVLVSCWAASTLLVFCLRRQYAKPFGILSGIALAMGIGIAMIGLAIDPQPRLWAIDMWR